MVGLNDRFRDALADRPDVPAAELYLRRSGPGFCLHEPLRAYSARTRRLLTCIEEVGAAVPTTMAGYDLVHLDYQPANVLVDDTGALTGIVDWDGAARGDAGFDLVVLLFGLHATAESAAAIALLEDRLRCRLSGDLLRTYWAHMSLRLVDWAIRHHGPDEVDVWLQLADHGLHHEL
ncbi:MAG: phosphotransferase family protein [Streptosporangiales bacterium]